MLLVSSNEINQILAMEVVKRYGAQAIRTKYIARVKPSDDGGRRVDSPALARSCCILTGPSGHIWDDSLLASLGCRGGWCLVTASTWRSRTRQAEPFSLRTGRRSPVI